jgi:hypothetical protein
MTFGTWRWWGHQPLPSGNVLVLILTRGWVDPRAMVRSEGNMSLKNPVTPPGIDPGTVRLEAQHLNHYATPSPLLKCVPALKSSPQFPLGLLQSPVVTPAWFSISIYTFCSLFVVYFTSLLVSRAMQHRWQGMVDVEPERISKKAVVACSSYIIDVRRWEWREPHKTICMLFNDTVKWWARTASALDGRMSTEHWRNDTGRKNRSTWRKTCPSATLPIINPTWDWTRASVVRRWR